MSHERNNVYGANWSAVYSLAIGVAGLIIAEFLPVGVLTPIARDLGVSEGMAGQAVSASAIIATVTSLFIAYLTRGFDRRKVLLVLSSLLTFSSLVVAFAPNFTYLIFGRLLLGVAVGGFWSMATAIAIRLVPEDQVTKALAIIFGASSFASVLAAPMGSFLGNIIGWRNVFFVAAVVGGAGFIWQYLTLPSLKPVSKISLRTIIDIFKIPEFSFALIAIAFIYNGRFATFTYLRPFLETKLGLNANMVSIALLTFGLSYFIGNAFAPMMAKKSLRFALWFPPFALSIVALGIIFFSTSLTLTLSFVFLWGILFGPVAPIWSTWIAKKSGEFAETGGGLFVASIQAAAATGAVLGGIAFDFQGPNGVFILAFITWLIAAGIIYYKIHTPFNRQKLNEVIGDENI